MGDRSASTGRLSRGPPHRLLRRSGRASGYPDRSSVNVVVTNDAGEILLIRRSDNDNWAVPGGAVDLGESVAEAAVRETREESGIDCQITGLVGIYSDPKHVILYTSDGEVRQEFSIVLTATAGRRDPTPSSETSEVRWVPVGQLGRVPDGPIDALAGRALPGGARHPYIS